MSDLITLRRDHATAREKLAALHAEVERGSFVEPIELGSATRAVASAEASLIDAERAALLSLPEAEYQARRAALVGGNFTRTL